MGLLGEGPQGPAAGAGGKGVTVGLWPLAQSANAATKLIFKNTCYVYYLSMNTYYNMKIIARIPSPLKEISQNLHLQIHLDLSVLKFLLSLLVPYKVFAINLMQMQKIMTKLL